MPETKGCRACNGTGVVEYLVSMHDDETEIATCNVCKGRKVIHYMTGEEEDDYKQNNDSYET